MVSQQPPNIVAPFFIIFFANSAKTFPVTSCLFPRVIFGFLPISLNPALFIGCEYFIIPKIAIGAEYSYGPTLSISEKIDFLLNGHTGSLRMNFYF